MKMSKQKCFEFKVEIYSIYVSYVYIFIFVAQVQLDCFGPHASVSIKNQSFISQVFTNTSWSGMSSNRLNYTFPSYSFYKLCVYFNPGVGCFILEYIS